MTKTNSAQDSQSELAALRSAKLEAQAAPDRIVVVPWGQVQSTAGSFVVDEESARLTLDAFAEHGTDLPIDFEHQTLGGEFASPTGQAPAAGWIAGLEAVPGEGIVAKVNWTEDAARLLAERAYRYLSPVALIRKQDRKLVAIHSAALTNKPAIVGMNALVNREPSSGDDGEGAVADLLAAAESRIVALESEAARRDAEAQVAKVMGEGKLTDAQRDWAMALAMKDRALFDAWAETAPVVVPLGRSVPPANGDGCGGGAHAVACRARSEFRASRLLQTITTEDAYVADAMRMAVAG